jgi:hypothetical protein
MMGINRTLLKNVGGVTWPDVTPVVLNVLVQWRSTLLALLQECERRGREKSGTMSTAVDDDKSRAAGVCR